MTTTTADPRHIEAPHFADDEDKLAELTEAMQRDGWVGAPIVVIDRDDADPLAITGSHRLAAAREASINVPTVTLAGLLAEHGVDFADLAAGFEAAGLDGEDAALEVAIRVDTWLPADVVEHYGLDMH